MYKEARELFPGIMFHHIDTSGMDLKTEYGILRKTSSDNHNSIEKEYSLLVLEGAPKNEIDRVWKRLLESNSKLPKNLQEEHIK